MSDPSDGADEVTPSSVEVICSGFLVKSPRTADELDPAKPTGAHSWKKRYFRLVAGGPRVCSVAACFMHMIVM
jgi:hypothetical protein